VQSFLRQLLTSLAFIHKLGYTHTDLKPENILLEKSELRLDSSRDY
jgi:dual-specificity kinase